MQSQKNCYKNLGQPQVNDIRQIPLEQRKNYALKMTEYMSRWKDAKKINLNKWKKKIIKKLSKANILKLQAHHGRIYESLSQLLVQFIYLIYTAAMNKINLQISTNIYLTQQFTVFGVYSLPQLDLSRTYQQLLKTQKTLPFTFNQFKDIVETHQFQNLYSNIDKLKLKYPKSVPKIMFQNQIDFIFYNFQFRALIQQDDLKDIILFSVNIILKQLASTNNSSQSIQNLDNQSLPVNFSQKNFLKQIEVKALNQTFINQLENVSAAWSDNPMKYLQTIEKQVQLMRVHSIYGKYRRYSLEAMLLNHQSKVKLLAQIMTKQKRFYVDTVQKYSIQNNSLGYENFFNEFINDYQLFQNIHFYTNILGNQIPVFLSIKQQQIDFNYVNNQGGFVIEDTIFKHLSFMVNPNVKYPDHMILQQIETIKRQILLRKTSELINLFEILFQFEQNSQFYGVYLEHDYYTQLCQKAEQIKVRQVDMLSQQINKKLYFAQINHYESLKQGKGEDARMTQIINETQHETLFEIPILKLELLCSALIQDQKQKNQTIPEDKSQSDTKYPYIQILWAVKFLKRFLLEKQLYKCQINENLLVYLPQVRLVCPHKIKQQVFKEFYQQLIRLNIEHWSKCSQNNEIISASLLKRKDDFNVMLMIGFSDHNLSNFILPLLCSIGMLMTYYFNLQRVLQFLELRSNAGQKENSYSQDQILMYTEELEKLEEKMPHNLQLTRSFQFALKQKLADHLQHY